jgi:hypothetical protein
MSETNTNTAASNTKIEFKTENPTVTYQNINQAAAVTNIDTGCGFTIKRGMGNIAKSRPCRKNLTPFFNAFQIGDVVEVTNQKQAVNLSNCARYRGMKTQQAKQENGVIQIQRIS